MPVVDRGAEAGLFCVRAATAIAADAGDADEVLRARSELLRVWTLDLYGHVSETMQNEGRGKD